MEFFFLFTQLGHLAITLIQVLPQVGRNQQYDKTLYTIALQFPFPDTMVLIPNLPQHDKARSIKTFSVKVGVKELEWTVQSSDFNPIEHLVKALWNAFSKSVANENEC